MTITRFRVAISYASAVPERFELVAQVAEHLAAAVGGPQHVLYDRFHEAEFSRPDLDEHLIPLYLDHSELMVVFLDEHYERSQWCGLEWRVVRALIKQRKQSTVMLVRFDATQPKALLGLAGFLDIDGRTAETIASLVLQRWEQETGGPRQSWPPASREPARTSTAVQAQPPPPKVAPTRLPPPACPIFGREEELARLDAAWASSGADQTNVVTLVAWGGVGKTALLFEWMNRLGREGWRGARAVFDWSFYSQGVREQGAPSGDQFIDAALRFFGDEGMADSAAAAQDKGARLAELVAEQRTLLVLDGLEPLQHPPGRGAERGTLTDPAVATLLHGLARHNPGLCVVTTREAVPRLAGFGPAVERWDLERLSKAGSDALMRFLLEDEPAGAPPVTSTALERVEVWTELRGHALTLQLLARYIRRALGDFRRWREVELHRADHEVQGDHAFRMMAAYERWLSGELAAADEIRGEGWRGRARPRSSSRPPPLDPVAGRRQLAVLRLLGLFDRPADPGCIGALCDGGSIGELTGPLVGLDAAAWELVLSQLGELGLVSRVEREMVRITGFRKDQTDVETGKTTGEPETVTVPGWSRLSVALDAHPLVREYFGRRVRETSEAAWRPPLVPWAHATTSSAAPPRPCRFR